MENKRGDLVEQGTLGEGPESRMVNFPKKKPEKNDLVTGGNPGKPQPASADASGEGDADELAEQMDDSTVRQREEDASRDHPGPPNPRQRAKESRND